MTNTTAVRQTAIEKSSTPKTIKWIAKNEEKLRFDLAIQRNGVWKHDQRSLFVHSLMYGFPFPPAYAQDTNDGFLWLLDGKQRLTCVIDYLNDRFELHKDTPDVFGIEVAGMKFSELPENLQDEIKDTNFTIVQLKNMTDAERDTMFVRLNGGTALSKLEVTRAMNSDMFAEVGQLADLPFFVDVMNISASSRNRFVDQEIVVQIAMLLDNNHELGGFSGNHIRDYVLTMKEEKNAKGHNAFTKAKMKQFKDGSTYLEEAFDEFEPQEIKKVLKKVNVPMIFVQAIKAKEQGMKPDQYGEFVRHFFIDKYSVESIYGQACQSGSAKRENVLKRLKEVDKAFNRFARNNNIELQKTEMEEKASRAKNVESQEQELPTAVQEPTQEVETKAEATV